MSAQSHTTELIRQRIKILMVPTCICQHVLKNKSPRPFQLLLLLKLHSDEYYMFNLKLLQQVQRKVKKSTNLN